MHGLRHVTVLEVWDRSHPVGMISSNNGVSRDLEHFNVIATISSNDNGRSRQW
tara:strand:+ start:15393 stop:15551 length:159 start_codon:yes stop_codon:yes gene_type:complete